MKGFALSETTKQKISIAKKGNKSRLGCKNSEKHKEIIASIWKGKKLSEEHKKKMSLAKMGKKRNNDTKRKKENAN